MLTLELMETALQEREREAAALAREHEASASHRCVERTMWWPKRRRSAMAPVRRLTGAGRV
jgi:hypothetical protein